MAQADLERENTELRAIVDVLKGVAAAQDIQVIDLPKWALDLTPQQREFIGILMKARGVVDRWDILERLSGRDHVAERDTQFVDCLVYRIRKRLGRNCIETIDGGYRLAPALRQQIAA